jgi:RNA polymerase sigma factor (sigma-70 family)
MPGGPARRALEDLRTLFRFGVVADLGDGELLDRFVTRRDEDGDEAFTMLVRRHGPMVFGVCRRILGSSHEAEDAFQAAFLVLARKANAIARRETLANWLFGVALRTAKDARARARRRRAWEERACELRVVHAAGDDPPEELRQILDEELARLPARFRVPVLLCELESLSRQEAARRLGIPEGTLSSRLARAKVLLRERLTRRGLGISTSLLSACMAQEAQAAVVSGVLAESTIRAATRIAAGCSATGLVTASVHSLMEEVLKAMVFAKLKSVTVALVTAGAVVTGAMVLAQDPVARREEPPTKSADPTVGMPSREELPTKTASPFLFGRRSDPDRLNALEQKLDRILDELGHERPSATTPPARYPPGGTMAPDLAVNPLRYDSFRKVPAETKPAPERTDRLTAVEQRMADLERRMAEIEKRVNQAGTSTSATVPQY